MIVFMGISLPECEIKSTDALKEGTVPALLTGPVLYDSAAVNFSEVIASGS
jgi:hypothetical protein